MKFEPSDKDIVRHFTKLLSKSVNNNTDAKTLFPEWFALVENNNEKQFRKIYGQGEIKSDFFKIRTEYEPIRKLGYWTRFRNWISKQFLKVLPKPNEVGTIKRTKPLFLGPVIGYLHYELDLMKDTHIVAVCTIEEGKIIPTVTAISKSDILTYFERKIQKNYLQVAGFLILSIVMARWLWSDIKAMLNALKVKRQKLTSTYFNPDVADDKVCIICYANCRNMVFFDCRHMIMCRQCSENYQSDTCPYCKLEIDDVKIVSGIK